MRKLNEQDLAAIVGTTQKGYTILEARVKDGYFSDSDHFGIVLGRNDSGHHVTWQFHIDEEELSFYWGHYIEDAEAALDDYKTRDR
jgi:hypothetical protein